MKRFCFFIRRFLTSARLVTVLFAACLAASASAATITVNSLADGESDDGQCTLREAIIAANSNQSSGSTSGECLAGESGSSDRIEFAPGVVGVIDIDGVLPEITESVDIIGPGAEDLTIDAGGQVADGPVLFFTASSTISSLRMVNAVSTGDGGAIRNNAPLEVRNMVFENNRALAGGAILGFADLIVDRTIIRGNFATQFSGGGLRFAGSEKTLVLRRSLIQDNAAIGEFSTGGGVSITGIGHTSEISESTFIGNRADGENREGGGLRDVSQTLYLTNSTFFDNAATGSGGGVALTGFDQFVANVTISGNTADSDNDGVGNGGGGYFLNGPVFRNSIIAGNEDRGGEAPDCFAFADSDGYNLIGIDAGCSGFSAINNDQVGSPGSPIDPMLGPPTLEGGPTATMALLAGSPALDAGNPGGCVDALGAPLLVDQRGAPRPADGDGDSTAVCDVGAYELNIDSIFVDRFQQ